MLAVCFLIVWCMPNSNELTAKYEPILGGMRSYLPERLQWQPNVGWGLAIGALAAVSVLFMSGATEFLYFQF